MLENKYRYSKNKGNKQKTCQINGKLIKKNILQGK